MCGEAVSGATYDELWAEFTAELDRDRERRRAWLEEMFLADLKAGKVFHPGGSVCPRS